MLDSFIECIEMPRKVSVSPPSPKLVEHRVIVNKTHTQYAVVGRIAKRLGWNTFSEHSVDASASVVGSGGSPRGGESLGSSSPIEEDQTLVRKQVDWNIYWTDSGLNIDRVVRAAKLYQKVNHFPGMVNIYRKSNLARSMSKMVKLNSKEYGFFPKTWLLPAEGAEVMKYLNHNLTSAVERSQRCIIVKPSGGAQGKGIYLCMHPEGLTGTEDAVAQVYIHRPLLINSFKFDLRIYALVTCVDPLRVLLYREGLVRLCTTPYKTPDVSNVGISYMHLTNYSVNKHNDAFVENNLDEEGDASKRSLSWLWQWMGTQGHSEERVARVWRDIGDVVTKTLISIQSTLAVNYASSKIGSANSTPFTCFEVLGFDILLTESLAPVLIEVNHTPSFRTDSALDAQVKEGLVSDTMQLLNVASDDRHKYLLRTAALSQMRLYGDLYDESPRSRQRASRAQGDTTERQWESYIRNEQRCKGGFDVIYPATESEDEHLKGRQPVYEELIRAAADTYWNSDLARLVAVPPPPPPLQRASSPAAGDTMTGSPRAASAEKEKAEREKKQVSAATRQKMLRDKEREKLREKEKEDRKRRSLQKKKKAAARRSKDSLVEEKSEDAPLPPEDKGQDEAGADGSTNIDLQSVGSEPELDVDRSREDDEWVHKRVAALSTPSTASRLRGRREIQRRSQESASTAAADMPGVEQNDGNNDDGGDECAAPETEEPAATEVKDDEHGEEETENEESRNLPRSMAPELAAAAEGFLPPAPPPQHRITEPIRPLRELRTSTEKRQEGESGAAPSPSSLRLASPPSNGFSPVVAQAMGGLNEIEVLRARYSEYRNRWLKEYRDAAALRSLN